MAYGICVEKNYYLGSFDLVLHSSINRCVVNGRDAMAAHSRDIYLFIYLIIIRNQAEHEVQVYLYVPKI